MGPRGFRRRGAFLAAVMVATPSRVVAYCHPCLRVAPSTSVDDVVSIAVLSLPSHIKDPLLDQHSALVGWLPHCATCVDGCLLALGAAVVSRSTLLAYAGHRAFVLLHSRLLNACASRCRFHASGVEVASMAWSSVAAVMSFWLRVVACLGRQRCSRH
jgi:hypothetical protein